MTAARQRKADLAAAVAALVARPKVVLSLGAGVQSSTLPLMCAEGDLTERCRLCLGTGAIYTAFDPDPCVAVACGSCKGQGATPIAIDAGVFADTKRESKATYRWLADWLLPRLTFPVHIVSRGDLGKDGLEMRTSAKGLLYWKCTIPFFVQNPNGTKGRMKRKCTTEYKIREIIKCVRKIVGPSVVRAWQRIYNVKRERVEIQDAKGTLKKIWRWIVPPGTPHIVESLIGFSLDEFTRMKPSREPWILNRHPLIDANMTRAACIRWMLERGFPEPPRSACIFCPFRSDAEWLKLKKDEPESFADAVQFEAAAAAAACQVTKGKVFLHSSRKPLPMVDFDPEKTGSLFDGECLGICGS